MKWESIKTSTDIKLDGVKVHVEYRDKNVTSIAFRDGAGNMLRVALHSYNVLGLYVPAPPETEKRHVLTGHIMRVPVREVFENKYEAEARMTELGVDGTELKIAVEGVPVDPAPEKPDDGIPF